jgi:hypothetical protein
MQRFIKPCVVGLVVLMAVLAWDQKASALPNGLEVGFKGGVNIGSCSGFDSFLDPEEWGSDMPSMDEGSRIAMMAGCFAVYWLGDHVAIQPELLYSQAGCKRDMDIDLGDAQGEIKTTTLVDYLEIPVLIRYSFSVPGMSSAFICGGPSIGLKTGAKFEIEASQDYLGETFTYKETIDIDDFIKGSNFSLVIGGGYVWALSWGGVGFEVRYALGLVDVMETTGRVQIEEDEYLYLDEAKPRTLSVVVGLAFR